MPKKPKTDSTLAFTSDKKVGEFSWREMARAAESMRALRRKMSFSQDEATFNFANAKKPVAIISLSDLHYGSYGTNHNFLEKLTDEILSIPDLYIIVVGDLEQMAIKLRGVLEVSDNVLTPEMQHAFTESWLQEIGHRIICVTWDNHSVEREENQAGSSAYKTLVSRKVVYHSGIGHVNIGVGKQLYKLAVSHVFRGRSMENPCHGQMRYMRREGTDREIAIAGDSHVPGIVKYVDGEKIRLAINCGAAQEDSGYGKRYFSLKTHAVFPVLTLHPDRHEFTPYWSIKEWLEAKKHQQA